ncbi:MAG: hypothetical protein WAV95_03035 [Azonexus sp.]
MTPTIEGRQLQPHDHLLQYASTVDTMHHALHRIFANQKAMCESLTRTAVALRKISTAGSQKQSATHAE